MTNGYIKEICFTYWPLNLVIFCIRYLPVTVLKTMTKSNVGRKGLLNLIFKDHSLSLREIRTGTWRQKLNQVPERNATY